MWILKQDNNRVTSYLLLMKKNLSIKFNQLKLKTNVRPSYLKDTRSYQFLNEERFWKYLGAEPNELLKLHEELFSYIISDTFVQEEWEKVRNGNAENNLKIKYAPINDNEIKFIAHIFNYKNYIQENVDVSYEIAKIMNVNVCVYCNRQYIIVVTDNKKNLIRPEFDHWFSQCYYPDLSLSYYNLIPSCKYCNSSLKHKEMMELSRHIHPYIDKKIGFDFRYIPLGNGYSVDVQIDKSLPNDYQKKVEETLKLFRIQEIYNAHSDFELKDLLEIRNDYPGDYIETLVNRVLNDLKVSEEDVYRMLFGIETEFVKHQDRPFSKFKTDIIKQIKGEKEI